MDKEEETAFMQVFPIVLAVLVGLTVIIFVLARIIAPGAAEAALGADPRVKMQVEERITPVGRVHTTPPDEGTVAKAAQMPAEPRSGDVVYNGACIACHGTGVLNAPKKGDAAGWGTRLDKGIDGLLASSIKGMGAMPPRGGDASISDDELRAAIEYMLP